MLLIKRIGKKPSNITIVLFRKELIYLFTAYLYLHNFIFNIVPD